MKRKVMFLPFKYIPLLFLIPGLSGCGSQTSTTVQATTSGIIFETDFRNDGNYYDSGTKAIRYTNLPEGWDGIRTNNGVIKGVPGAGVKGSVALKFEWPAKGTALATSLFKHLTSNKNTGYKEVYIRYRVKLPNNFKAGSNGSALSYWKWGRLWQNAGIKGDRWSENRPDSYYVVWNWGSGLPRWGIRNNLVFGENLNTDSKGSAGGPRVGVNWYVGGSDQLGYHKKFAGHWDSVGNGAWEFDHSTRFLLDNMNQDWHTFEWRFKLSTTDTSNDGVFQVWFDGVEQIPPKVINDAGIHQPIDNASTKNSLITAAKPGFNFFVLFDNMSGWSQDWSQYGVEGGIYINDIVISTHRIGPNYNVGD